MDNYDRWEAHDAERQRELERLPRCSECDEPIQSEHCYEINDELICPDCMEKNHRKWVDDYCE
jgi:formylmethanofuran dehydrogenase subunit E